MKYREIAPMQKVLGVDLFARYLNIFLSGSHTRQ